MDDGLVGEHGDVRAMKRTRKQRRVGFLVVIAHNRDDARRCMQLGENRFQIRHIAARPCPTLPS